MGPSSVPDVFAGAEVGIVFAVIVLPALPGSLLFFAVTIAKRSPCPGTTP